MTVTPAEYLEREGLLATIVVDDRNDSEAGSIAPDLVDLARLHRLVRRRMSFTVLEFGIGFSTLVIADALAKNQAAWEVLNDPPSLRNANLWEVHVVDTSQRWMRTALARIPTWLRSRVRVTHSSVTIAEHTGGLCHYYDQLPNIVPDFVYLDGPDPSDVGGSIGGLSFATPDRTVMAADLLRLESTLLPGAFVLIDGRTNNARFLRRNLQRDWRHAWFPEADVTTLELTEPRLGRLNILGTDLLPTAEEGVPWT